MNGMKASMIDSCVSFNNGSIWLNIEQIQGSNVVMAIRSTATANGFYTNSMENGIALWSVCVYSVLADWIELWKI